MKFIFNKKIIIACLLAVLVLGAQSVLAQTPGANVPGSQPVGSKVPAGTFTLTNPMVGVTSIGQLVNKFVEILSYILIIFAVLMIVYTGLQFILARGNPEKMKEESKRLGYILIGVALVIGARILVMVVINTLEATGAVSPQVINQAKQGGAFK